MEDDDRALIVPPVPLVERVVICDACGRRVNVLTGMCGCNDR